MNQVHDTPFVRYIVRDHSILEVRYKKGAPLITKELAQHLVLERLALQGGKPCRLLLHGDTEISLSPEAKQFFASPEGREGIAAAAILLDKWALRQVTRLITFFQRSDFPLRIFRDAEEAKNWLLENSLHTAEWNSHPKSLSQQYVDYLFNHTPHMQLILNEQEKIVRANYAACQRLGYKEDQLIGRPFSDLTKGELKTLYDNTNQPVPVHINSSRFPTGHGGYNETLVIARETSVNAIRDLISKAAVANLDPRDKSQLQAALDALLRTD